MWLSKRPTKFRPFQHVAHFVQGEKALCDVKAWGKPIPFVALNPTHQFCKNCLRLLKKGVDEFINSD